MIDIDWSYWIATISGAAIRAFSDDSVHPFRGFITFCSGVFIAWVGTNPTLHIMHWDPETYRIGVAAVLALFGSNIVKMGLIATNDLKSIIDLVKYWRNGK